MKSKLRQAQNKQKQAIDKYNREVRKYNREVKSAVNKYNSEARKFNTQQILNRQRVKRELNKLNNSSSTLYVSYKTSVINLNNSYHSLASNEESIIQNEYGSMFMDLSDRENANSMQVYNQLVDDVEANDRFDGESVVVKILKTISSDLVQRWEGAIFSLNPANPDAARHFCTSAREVYIQLLEYKAPDKLVLSEHEECEKTDNGIPTRRSKIQYLLHKSGLDLDEAVTFVDENVKNVLKLFRTFNEGTHGKSGKFSYSQLNVIRKRVEDGIEYIDAISG